MRPSGGGGALFRPALLTFALVLAAAGVMWSPSALAQPLPSSEGVNLNKDVPRDVADVTVVQRLGEAVPRNLTLVDSLGRKVKTAKFFDGRRPTIITLNYSSCPMLCSVQLNALTRSLQELDLRLGQDFQILTVSIDPKETTRIVRETKQSYLAQVPNQPGASTGWTFCTASEPVIEKLAETLGFQYRYDRSTGEYYHPAMLAFVSPEGVITRYSLSVDFPPEQLELAILDSGEGKVGGPVQQFILWCYSYDPDRNSYVPQAWKLMRLGGAVTIGAVVVFSLPFWIGHKRSPRTREEPDDVAETSEEETSASDPTSGAEI